MITYTTNYELESYERSIQESLDYIRQFVNPSLKADYTKESLTAILEAQKLYAESQRESKKKQDVITELRRLKRGINTPSVAWYQRLAAVLG